MTGPDPQPDLVDARLLWQLGRWQDLAALGPMPQRPARRGKARTTDHRALHVFRLHGALQTGQTDLAQSDLDALAKNGIGPGDLAQILLSAAYNSLGLAWQLRDDPVAAYRCMWQSAALHPEHGSPNLIAELRLSQQARALADAGAPLRVAGSRPEPRCVFLDCGGNDGCSALQFLIGNPHFDCISFEPNPDLWHHYDDLPTELVCKAVHTYDGTVSFTLDGVDGDGSSLIPSKNIDWERNVANADFLTITVPCIDLSAYIRKLSASYDRIVLKLDVEGAEYDILEKMLSEKTIDLIDQLYCEFHIGKMEISQERHDHILADVSARVPVEDWDALPFSLTQGRSTRAREALRTELIRAIRRNRRGTLPLAADPQTETLQAALPQTERPDNSQP